VEWPYLLHSVFTPPLFSLPRPGRATASRKSSDAQLHINWCAALIRSWMAKCRVVELLRETVIASPEKATEMRCCTLANISANNPENWRTVLS